MKAVVCLMFACASWQSRSRRRRRAAGGQKVPLSEGLRRSYNSLKMNLTESAAEVWRGRLRLSPVARNSRPFGGQLAHVANSQFNACAAARGEANPHQGQNLEQTKTREPRSSRRSPIRLRSAIRPSRT